MSFTFTVFGALTITSGAPGAATISQVYTPFQFTASGGNTPYTWSATGLPAGMSLSSTGLLTGTPTVSGSFSVNVTVTDTP